MALVGTISGSNGTTTSAVSGSLIIANQPPGSFPSLPAGFNFFVSGARAPDAGSASALFGGDVFMSGALTLVGSFTATGSIKALSGFSGSLTKLTDGTDYLIAGSNITFTTGSNGGVTVANTSIPTLGAIYGGGADGAFDLDGTNTYASQFTKSGSVYTQIVDVRSTTLQVRNGVTLLPSQFWIYAETTVTVDSGGIIQNNGNAASGGTGGAQKAAAGTLQTIAQSGATGRTTPSNTGAAGNATTSTIGGASGAGGTGGGANLGGAGGAAGAIAATTQGLGTSIFRTSHRLLATSTLTASGGGCGGGSGGLTLNAGTGASGAGGGGASAIRINARAFTNNGSITCNGGLGGNASVTSDAVAGGGGGGGGGFIGVMTDTYTSTGTITCLGGNGGTGAGTGAGAGVAGSAGKISIMTTTGTTNS